MPRTLFRQLIEGMDYLHSNGISHLDIKLDNLVLSDDGLLKIIDFDASHQKDSGKKIISRGTKVYRAPEIRSSECENGFAADIYSCGILLFCFVMGRYPYLEKATV